MLSFLSGKKTYIVAVVTLIYGVVVVGWQGHDWANAWNYVLAAASLVGLRAGVTKSGQ
jgi:hypothetical protein